MKLCAVQLDSQWENPQASYRRVEELLADCPPPPGSLVALPEMFATGFSMNVKQVAESEEQPGARFLASVARKHDVTVIGGLVTRGPDGRGRNEAVVFAPDGQEILRYQKIHPFKLGGEADHYEAGREIWSFEWNGFRVTPFVCYDLRFPEIFRAAVQHGTNLFVVIASWPLPRDEHWVTLLRARAIENQAYVMGVNRCGKDPKLTHPGRSLIVDHHGKVLVEAGGEETVISSEVDLADLNSYREWFPALPDMRCDYPELGLRQAARSLPNVS